MCAPGAKGYVFVVTGPVFTPHCLRIGKSWGRALLIVQAELRPDENRA